MWAPIGPTKHKYSDFMYDWKLDEYKSACMLLIVQGILQVLPLIWSPDYHECWISATNISVVSIWIKYFKPNMDNKHKISTEAD